jgi:hypothetical protein
MIYGLLNTVKNCVQQSLVHEEILKEGMHKMKSYKIRRGIIMGIMYCYCLVFSFVISAEELNLYTIYLGKGDYTEERILSTLGLYYSFWKADDDINFIIITDDVNEMMEMVDNVRLEYDLRISDKFFESLTYVTPADIIDSSGNKESEELPRVKDNMTKAIDGTKNAVNYWKSDYFKVCLPMLAPGLYFDNDVIAGKQLIEFAGDADLFDHPYVLANHSGQNYEMWCMGIFEKPEMRYSVVWGQGMVDYIKQIAPDRIRDIEKDVYKAMYGRFNQSLDLLIPLINNGCNKLEDYKIIAMERTSREIAGPKMNDIWESVLDAMSTRIVMPVEYGASGTAHTPPSDAQRIGKANILKAWNLQILRDKNPLELTTWDESMLN